MRKPESVTSPLMLWLESLPCEVTDGSAYSEGRKFSHGCYKTSIDLAHFFPSSQQHPSEL